MLAYVHGTYGGNWGTIVILCEGHWSRWGSCRSNHNGQWHTMYSSCKFGEKKTAKKASFGRVQEKHLKAQED